MTACLERDEKYWREKLTPEQYAVMREKATERAFSGEFVDTKLQGMYRCAGCGTEVFDSSTKFDSGTGWPSFHGALPGAVRFKHDDSFDMHRTEVICVKCGSHLGHVFDDGAPAEGRKHFCINSCALDLKEKQ